MKRHKITKVDEGGIAEELGIEEGDFLLAINDKEIEDIFDYDFIVNDEYLEVLIEKANGEEWLLEVEKDYDEDLGMEFGESLMDEYRSCFNKCVFCFIDQNPPGMRETIYFKDDDTRLSFLQGNYVTLTNMKEKDIQRIIDYKLAPINISVHTTNPELRCQMLHNRFAGKVMDYIQMLYDADIPMNAQVVLCKGLNDGDELRRTIGDLLAYAPTIESLSVVPVGLSSTGMGSVSWRASRRRMRGKSSRLSRASNSRRWRSLASISCMRVMSGISQQVMICRGKTAMTAISSWKMVLA